VFYIGKGKGSRSHSHEGRNKLWKNIVAKHGLEVRIWADNLSEEAAFAMEKDWIKLYGRRDLGTGCLVNLTDGGEGQSNPSAEHRAKISAAHTGNKYTLGLIHTAETKAKMSAAKIGNKSNLGIPKSAEHRDKLSTANQARVLARGRLPGTSLHKCGKWTCTVRINRKSTYLGLYLTEQQAHAAYLEAKAALTPPATSVEAFLSEFHRLRQVA